MQWCGAGPGTVPWLASPPLAAFLFFRHCWSVCSFFISSIFSAGLGSWRILRDEVMSTDADDLAGVGGQPP